MEKRVTTLSTDPHTVSLTDRKCSLFIDPISGSIFVDEGDGDGRINGAVFSAGNSPTFLVQPSGGCDHRLVLDYCGIQYLIGVSEDVNYLRRWAESANSLLTEKFKRAQTGWSARPQVSSRDKFNMDANLGWKHPGSKAFRILLTALQRHVRLLLKNLRSEISPERYSSAANHVRSYERALLEFTPLFKSHFKFLSDEFRPEMTEVQKRFDDWGSVVGDLNARLDDFHRYAPDNPQVRAGCHEIIEKSAEFFDEMAGNLFQLHERLREKESFLAFGVEFDGRNGYNLDRPTTRSPDSGSLGARTDSANESVPGTRESTDGN